MWPFSMATAITCRYNRKKGIFLLPFCRLRQSKSLPKQINFNLFGKLKSKVAQAFIWILERLLLGTFLWRLVHHLDTLVMINEKRVGQRTSLKSDWRKYWEDLIDEQAIRSILRCFHEKGGNCFAAQYYKMKYQPKHYIKTNPLFSNPYHISPFLVYAHNLFIQCDPFHF